MASVHIDLSECTIIPKRSRNKVHQFIYRTFSKLLEAAHIDIPVTVYRTDLDCNPYGGSLAVTHDKHNDEIMLIVFSCFFEEAGKLGPEEKIQLERALSHEAGHLVVWNLGEVSKERHVTSAELNEHLEVAASKIGRIINDSAQRS